MKALRIAKIGKDAVESTEPNDFVFNTDYNTPKIILEGIDSPTLGTTGSETFRDIAHGLNYTPFTIGFVKFANSRVGLVGTRASNAEFWSTNLRVNSSNVKFGYFNGTGGNYSPGFKYFCTEIPLAGTPSIAQESGSRLIIAKDGFNALTETNPNNLIYDSRFGTFKYYIEDSITINVPGGTPGAGNTLSYEQTIYTHNLGYYPFVSAQIEFSADLGKLYTMPVTFADAGVWNYDFLYWTTSGIIYRSEIGDIYGSTFPGYTVTIYYKIYSTDLLF